MSQSNRMGVFFAGCVVAWMMLLGGCHKRAEIEVFPSTAERFPEPYAPYWTDCGHAGDSARYQTIVPAATIEEARRRCAAMGKR